ncbi:MAG: 16S rRNA (cytosine(1402)-N(4))-methyltransferase RsmH [Planctomycetota bacterium]|nr:MAG: 16S rRNA (cytosine(1402)-N(4))-methyltransferase RsmH [Planctomycetota bacterium]
MRQRFLNGVNWLLSVNSHSPMTTADQRSVHVPVMPREVMQWLQLSAGLTVLDGTLGAGGHSRLILKSLGETGRLIGLDRDPMMLALATQNLASIQHPGTSFVRSSYADAETVLQTLGIERVDRVLLDLGLSSDQLSDRERGFGFDAGGPLDMRFHPHENKPVSELLRTLEGSELEKIFREFGEEPAAAKVASEIVRRRQQGNPVVTTEDLEACVSAAVGAAKNAGGRNSATRVFQALRIAANNELQHVERMLTNVLPNIMKTDGIVVILTFHSLEDRIVKNAFKGHQGWQVLTKTPMEATPAEVRLNPRSRSAKLRATKWLGSC